MARLVIGKPDGASVGAAGLGKHAQVLCWHRLAMCRRMQAYAGDIDRHTTGMQAYAMDMQAYASDMQAIACDMQAYAGD